MLGNFQNHHVTGTGLTWLKSRTRLGKNIESLFINHKTIPLLNKTIGMKSKQQIFSGSFKMKSMRVELRTYIPLRYYSYKPTEGETDCVFFLFFLLVFNYDMKVLNGNM